MKTYQIQFRDHTRLWRSGATLQMVPALMREFLDYLDDPTYRTQFGGKEGDEFRVVRTECKNPQYRYNGAKSVINLRRLGPM